MGKESPKDLKVRTASALVMTAVAGSALLAGGWVFTFFVTLVAAGLLWEWWGLISKFDGRALGRALWLTGGVVYIGGASGALWWARESASIGDVQTALMPILIVVAVDVGAYLAGRFIGGPKVWPIISPNKTWTGVFGGIFGAILVLFAGHILMAFFATPFPDLGEGFPELTVLNIVLFSLAAMIAEAGDFFESWLKRKAAVKDSGALIPGHGGLFDRLDGLIALLFCLGIAFLLLALLS